MDGDGIYDYCDDDNGCGVHAYRDTRYENPYGPGEEYRIDTTKPLRIRTDLQEGGDGLWTAMRTVFA